MGTAPGAPSLVRRIALSGPLDLATTLFPLRQGVADPTLQMGHGEAWRALRLESGPAVLHLRVAGAELEAAATGPGAETALEIAPRLAGLDDRPDQLRPLHPAVEEARRRAVGLRLTAGTNVFDALLSAVLAQKVVGLDARRSYRDLVRRLGRPAPGSQQLLLPPDPAVVARTPYWVFHQCNVERRRAAVIIEAAHRAASLDSLASVPAVTARRALESLTGVGPWTSAEVTAVTHGDPDAVPLGDFHLPNVVAYALAGEPRGDDRRMLELLEPYAGQRGRVARLLMSGGRGAPRFAPRLSRVDFRRR